MNKIDIDSADYQFIRDSVQHYYFNTPKPVHIKDGQDIARCYLLAVIDLIEKKGIKIEVNELYRSKYDGSVDEI